MCLKRAAFAVFICAFLFSTVSLAKSDKYKREQKAPAVDTQTSTDSKAQSAGPVTEADTTKKVDLTDLENRYWTAKDTEFNVVQNRLYTKAKKFSLTVTTGPLLTDTYTNSWNVGGALNYYFSERMGAELQGWKTSAADADFVNTFASKNGAFIDHNMPDGYLGVSFNWIPIYAKMSLLEKKILYFDFSMSPGIGATYLHSAEFATNVSPAASNVAQAPLTFALDFAEQVFLNEHFAIRLDVRNHFYNEQIYASSPPGGAIRTKSTFYGTIMLGLTLFQ
jgi:outer membrane beta-barrel protein